MMEDRHAEAPAGILAGFHLWLAMVGLAMMTASTGCAPVLLGGRYAVSAYDRSTGERVQPRLIIAFYDHFPPGDDAEKCWAEASGPEAAQRGIDYPLRFYWNWGYLGLKLDVPPDHFYLGICLLAEGYWPSIQNNNIDSADTTGVPERLWPGLYGGTGGATRASHPEPIPAHCDGVWRMLLIPSSHPYSETSWGVHTFMFPFFDAALASSTALTPEDKLWAYRQLLNLLEARLMERKTDSRRPAVEHWADVFRQRVSEWSSRVEKGPPGK
jgi:hypothetical protein